LQHNEHKLTDGLYVTTGDPAYIRCYMLCC